MSIRPATAADLPQITDLYNWAVDNTQALWVDDHVDIANRTQWLRRSRAALVAYDEGVFLGFASYEDFRAYPGYRHTVENSIYVHPDAQGRGVGGTLLQALVEVARSDDSVHTIIAAIEGRNVASTSLHYRAGFEEVGFLREVGFLKGEWLDLRYMQLTV
ncbi:N-acetyltransferase family protein [Corynebacterium sp. S7]